MKETEQRAREYYKKKLDECTLNFYNDEKLIQMVSDFATQEVEIATEEIEEQNSDFRILLEVQRAKILRLEGHPVGHIESVIIDGERVPIKGVDVDRVRIDRHDCVIDKVPYGSEQLIQESVIAKIPDSVEIRTNCPERKLKKEITIDPCLFLEIKHLWSLGIVTTGHCCGHNIGFAYIGVEEKFIPKMKELGYETQFNPMRPLDEDSFKPKSLK